MNENGKKKRSGVLDRWADGAMWWIGSTQSLVVHTAVFVVSFILVLLGVPFDRVLLVVTTAVSLEAIYMNIFIQMGVNRNTESLEEVEEDIDEIQKDVDDIQEDVEEMEKDIDEIQEDVDEMEKDDAAEENRDEQQRQALNNIERQLQGLIKEIERMKNAR